MNSAELAQNKLTMINMMIETCGLDYTFGWLKSAYIYPDRDPEIELDVMDRTINELLEMKNKEAP